MYKFSSDNFNKEICKIDGALIFRIYHNLIILKTQFDKDQPFVISQTPSVL